MLLNVSGRTDIVAFYSEWFMNRYREGFVDVRNPFNYKMISRIYFEDVDAIFFCSKNPIPIIKYLHEIDKPIIFHVTLTPYGYDIEPNVIPKGHIIEAIKKLSDILGIENVYVRYDPIFISDRYDVEFHKKQFDRLCTLLDGYVKYIIVSFIDEYKNVRNNKHILNTREFKEEDYKEIGLSFSKSASLHGMSVQTCFEDRNLGEYGFKVAECFSTTQAYQLTGKKYKVWTARKERKCECVQLVDIGLYNSCPHFCKYCYANYDEKLVKKHFTNHNPKSSLLVGEIQEDDIIKLRKK